MDLDLALSTLDRRIALVRGSGYGDVLAIVNVFPALKALYPDYRIDFFTFGDDLAPLLKAAGVSEVIEFEEIDQREQDYLEVFWVCGHTQGLEDRVHPHIDPSTHHFIDFVLHELRLSGDWRDFPQMDLGFPCGGGDYITIHPFTGGSVYREWPFERWQAVIDAFPGQRFVQIGLPSDRRLERCDTSHLGDTLMGSIGVIASGKLHLGGDTFSTHAAHLARRPAVVVWGATKPENSGYPEHVNLTARLDCSPCFKENPPSEAQLADPDLAEIYASVMGDTYLPCERAKACMAEVSVDSVIGAVRAALEVA